MGVLTLPKAADDPTSFQNLFGHKPRRYLTREQALQLKADAEAGMTVKELMAKYDVSKDPIRRILGGQSAKKKRVYLTDQQTEALRRDHEADPSLSFGELGRRYGISDQTAINICRRVRGRDRVIEG